MQSEKSQTVSRKLAGGPFLAGISIRFARICVDPRRFGERWHPGAESNSHGNRNCVVSSSASAFRNTWGKGQGERIPFDSIPSSSVRVHS